MIVLERERAADVRKVPLRGVLAEAGATERLLALAWVRLARTAAPPEMPGADRVLVVRPVSLYGGGTSAPD
jgi:hypothetical protein